MPVCVCGDGDGRVRSGETTSEGFTETVTGDKGRVDAEHPKGPSRDATGSGRADFTRDCGAPAPTKRATVTADTPPSRVDPRLAVALPAQKSASLAIARTASRSVQGASRRVVPSFGWQPTVPTLRFRRRRRPPWATGPARPALGRSSIRGAKRPSNTG